MAPLESVVLLSKEGITQIELQGLLMHTARKGKIGLEAYLSALYRRRNVEYKMDWGEFVARMYSHDSGSNALASALEASVASFNSQLRKLLEA